MSMPERFARQYQANLQAYQRQTPWRFLKLIIAFVVAILVGGLLHLAKDWPAPLFYLLVGFLSFLAAILLVVKLISLYARTSQETRYIVHGEGTDPIAPADIVAAELAGPGPFAPAGFAGPLAIMPAPPRRSAAVWLAALGFGVLLLCSGCVTLPLVIWFVGVRARPEADRFEPAAPWAEESQRSVQRLEAQIKEQEDDLRRRWQID
jgi:hypothetical protein